MNGEKQCWTCIYAINNVALSCTNKYVKQLGYKPDKYNCEFYDPISDSYIDDMKKVVKNT